MPSRPCKHPTCAEYVPPDGAGYCTAHAQDGRRARSGRDRVYDLHARDREAKKFYASAAWQRARRAVLAESPVCQRCQRAWARHCHHVVPLARCTLAQRTARENLAPLCPRCHAEVEAETEGGRYDRAPSEVAS